MDVHKPKPVHNWRELASEIAIIVVGVLIALGAEQVVEKIHWSHQLNAARAEMGEELHRNAYAAYERLVAADCIAGRVARLHGALLASTGLWRADPAPPPGATDGQPALAYKAPWRQWGWEAWDALLASGTASHMDSGEMTAWSRAYSLVREMRVVGGSEQQDLARLSDLSADLPLNDVNRQGFLQALADARFDNLRGKALAREILQAMPPLKVQLTEAERKQDVTDIRHSYGDCAAVPTYPVAPG